MSGHKARLNDVKEFKTFIVDNNETMLEPNNKDNK